MAEQLDSFPATWRPASVVDEGIEPSLAVKAERLQADLDVAATRAENLQRGLKTSRDIGMAVGILMHQRKLSADQAFQMLRTVSQHQPQSQRARR